MLQEIKKNLLLVHEHLLQHGQNSLCIAVVLSLHVCSKLLLLATTVIFLIATTSFLLSSVVKCLDTNKRSSLAAGSTHARKKFPQETRERGSHLAQQRARKMQKMCTLYSSKETRQVSSLCISLVLHMTEDHYMYYILAGSLHFLCHSRCGTSWDRLSEGYGRETGFH